MQKRMECANSSMLLGAGPLEVAGESDDKERRAVVCDSQGDECPHGVVVIFEIENTFFVLRKMGALF